MVDQMIKRLITTTSVITLCAYAALTAQNAMATKEVSVQAGLQSYTVKQLEEDNSLPDESESGTGLHLGLSVKKGFGDHNQHWFGFGVDRDQIMGQRMLALRALDYEYQLTNQVRLGAFFGAATLDTGLPQNGYYTGFNASYLDIMKNLDLVAEFRHGNGLARDRRLQSDPMGERPDMFLDFTSLALSVRWSFGR